MYESDVEEFCLELLAECGYEIIHGSKVGVDEPGVERASYADVILTGRLRDALARINDDLRVVEGRLSRRPDIVLFVNGLPLGLFELKNAASESATVRKAFNQLQTYKRDLPRLLAYNELLFVSDGLAARAGTLTADWERFSP